MDPAFGIKFFGALFAIMNPLINLPIFLSMTNGYSVADQRRAALMILLYSAIMCAVIAVAGNQILGFFGISVDDFRLAGGIVLGGIALKMLNGETSASHTAALAHPGSAQEKPQLDAAENIAFYPMTFPMIVGPGTITALVVFLGQANSAADKLTYGLVVAAVLLMLGLVLYFAADIGRHLSLTLRTIMSRLMGMILLAIAVEMMAAGAIKLLPGLAGVAATAG